MATTKELKIDIEVISQVKELQKQNEIIKAKGGYSSKKGGEAYLRTST